MPKRTGVLVWIVGLLLAAAGGTALGSVPYPSYTYNYWGYATLAPQAYVPSVEIAGDQLGVGSFSNPQDLFVGSDGTIYILDSGNNRIVVLDRELELVRVIERFHHLGNPERFHNPQGLFVTDGGRIYVADTGNRRLVELTADGTLVRVLAGPDAELDQYLIEDFDYQPVKIGVDPVGRIYVLSRGVYEGLMQFTVDGGFSGFIGAPRVVPSPVDVFWQRIATDAQLERIQRFIPTEFSNLAMDERGFIFVIRRGAATGDTIRRINHAGRDVMSHRGFHPPVGDVRFPYAWQGFSRSGASVFVDIVAHKHGMYSVLDRNRGRVFTYDDQGNLLYVFGGRGHHVGLMANPVAVAVFGEKMAVLDAGKNVVQFYRPTEYGNAIHAAIAAYHSGRLDDAAQWWQEVLRLNANYDLAYSGVGRSLYMQGQYAKAMEHFLLGNDRPYYSRAFARYRRQVLGEHFGSVMLLLAVLAVGFFGGRILLIKNAGKIAAWAAGQTAAASDSSGVIRKHLWRTLQSLWYAMHLIFHPFDGFWDLKHEQRGTVPAATILVLLVTGTYLFMRQATGFLFNPRNLDQLNVPLELSSIGIPFLAWCLVNWSLTTLMDGKGSLKDVFIATAFALTPFVLINIPLTFASNFLTLEEGTFYYMLLVTSLVWSGLLVYCTLMVTHDYGAIKAGVTGAVTIAGVVLVFFLSLLFFTLIDQMYGFLHTLYSEVVLRL